MLNTQQHMMADWYLTYKASFSQLNDQLMQGTPHKPLPSFTHPKDAVNYYMSKGNPYTGDPLYGALDFYTHPERLQAALEIGKEQIQHTWIDCDDVALWYFATCRNLPGIELKVVTLIDARITGSHVICVGTYQGEHFGMDTNGWCVLPDLQEDTICAHWNDVYKERQYQYIGALDTKYPFV